MAHNPAIMAHTKCLCKQCTTQLLASGWPAASGACVVANPPEEQNMFGDCQDANCAQTKAAAEQARVPRTASMGAS